MRIASRIAVVAAAAVPVLMSATPADAGTRWIQRSDINRVSSAWREVGELPGVAGNWHVGSFLAEGDRTVQVFGEVLDLTCEPGVVPPLFVGGHGGGGGGGGFLVGGGGGGGGEIPGCVTESVRFISGGENLVLTLDRKLASARLTGRFFVDNHGTGTIASPPVDVTWTGVGTAYSSTTTSKETYPDGSSYDVRRVDEDRSAVMSGSIGAMVYDDEADETSTGSLGTAKESTRYVQP